MIFIYAELLINKNIFRASYTLYTIRHFTNIISTNMRKDIILVLALACPLFFYQCQETSTDSTDNKEEAKPKEQDRNMFGLHIPRGVTIETPDIDEGYILFCEPNGASTYLINRKGKVVHKWKGNYGVAGAYLNDDGSLFQNVADVDFPVFAGGGESGRLQKIDWNSKILWDFEYSNFDYCHHHDLEVLPNGNVLAIAWESKSYDESVAAGRDPDQTPKAGLWPDKIVEIKPEGKYHGQIVWEWHMWDHLIQDFDQTKANYGNPADHPELLDINKGRKMPPIITQDSMDILIAKGGQWRNRTADNRGSDIYHVNAIDYNPELDQITISSPNLNEIFIIDHSTTTSQAAGHRGGRWGKGGDILYRWGNPQNYQRGDSLDQKLFGQHDIRWVEKGKPGAGHLTVFNNDIPNGPDSMEYSAVYEIVPPTDEKGNYQLETNKAFGPELPIWTYVAPDTISFFSSFISGAHRLDNGNTFINEGARGRFFEVTPEGEIIWEYLNQFRGTIHKPNGDPNPPIPFAYYQFRSTFIPADHVAFEGKELIPLDPQPDIFKLPPPSEDKGEDEH